MDELEFWQPGMRLFSFTEPTPLFYEEAGWSSNTRQDRLATLPAWLDITFPELRSTHPPGDHFLCKIADDPHHAPAGLPEINYAHSQ